MKEIYVRVRVCVYNHMCVKLAMWLHTHTHTHTYIYMLGLIQNEVKVFPKRRYTAQLF
jgi:hypothetical protein